MNWGIVVVAASAAATIAAVAYARWCKKQEKEAKDTIADLQKRLKNTEEGLKEAREGLKDARERLQPGKCHITNECEHCEHGRKLTIATNSCLPYNYTRNYMCTFRTECAHNTARKQLPERTESV